MNRLIINFIVFQVGWFSCVLGAANGYPLLGLIGGPLSYYGGAKLGGLMFINMPAALITLAIGWAVITPILIWLSKRLDGMQPNDQVVQHA